MDKFVVVGIFCDAADAVAAHLRFGAVGIEHPHSDVGTFRRADEYQAIGADAEMAVADGLGERAMGRSTCSSKQLTYT